MPSIKEQIQQMNSDYQSYLRSKSDQLQSSITGYVFDVFTPTYERITAECEAIGHVNLETITRDDEERTRYYLCDECGKQIELGPTPQ